MHQPDAIMVVDDEKDIVTTTSSGLKKKGYTVHSFDNGNAAVEHIKKVGCNDCCVIVSDIRMPGMNGFELVRQVKALCPDMRIILSSAYNVTDLELKSAGIITTDGLLEKPYSIDRLVQLISKLLETKKQIQ